MGRYSSSIEVTKEVTVEVEVEEIIDEAGASDVVDELMKGHFDDTIDALMEHPAAIKEIKGRLNLLPAAETGEELCEALVKVAGDSPPTAVAILANHLDSKSQGMFCEMLVDDDRFFDIREKMIEMLTEKLVQGLFKLAKGKQ